MTACSTLLAPLMTPLLVWLMAGTMVEVDTLGMLLSIVYVIIAPIAAGLLCQRFLPRLTQKVTPYLPSFSSLAIALTVGIVVSHNADRLWMGGYVVIVVVMLHNLLGLLLGYLIGRLLRLPYPKNVALSIEVGMQNSGLASSLAVLHFAAYPLATVPGATKALSASSAWVISHDMRYCLTRSVISVKISLSNFPSRSIHFTSINLNNNILIIICSIPC